MYLVLNATPFAGCVVNNTSTNSPKKILLYFLLALVTFTLSGCGEEDGGGDSEGSGAKVVVKSGWHFQGRDCLACHNVELKSEEHLLVAGTLYKDSSVTNEDDLNNVCGGEIVVNFYDGTNYNNLIYSSTTYKDAASKGYNGKGNLFILQRKLGIISSGGYYIELATPTGQVLADKYLHKFSAQPYDINNPVDYSNQLSCNACHSTQATSRAYPLYVKSSAVTLCK